MLFLIGCECELVGTQTNGNMLLAKSMTLILRINYKDNGSVLI